MKFIYSNNKRLETHNVFTKILRIFIVPILNILPGKIIRSFMKKSSKDASTVVAKGGTTHALEAMYTRYHRNIFSRGVFEGLSDIFWHHMISQPKALRNRLKIVQSVFEKIIMDVIKIKKVNEKINILSIAGGSSRSIIYTLLNLKKYGINNKISVVVIDKDKKALDVGRNLSIELGIQDYFEWVHGNAYDIAKFFPTERFDIIEIVGLLDYLEYDRVINLLKLSYGIMNNEGYIIIANIMPNSEKTFVHKTGWPAMYYRKHNELHKLLNLSGFVRNIDIIIEPMDIHCVGIGQK